MYDKYIRRLAALGGRFHRSESKYHNSRSSAEGSYKTVTK